MTEDKEKLDQNYWRVSFKVCLNLTWYEAEIHNFYQINSAWMYTAVFNSKSLQNFYLTFITYKKSDLLIEPEYLRYVT